MVYDFQYSERTDDIIVSVLVIYIGNYYVKDEHCYAWAYTINIQNVGNSTVKLLNRNWEIIDNKGMITKVQGPGVVGENPVLKPGEVFEYTSGTSLKSSSGIMRGYYELINVDTNTFLNVKIPPFSLDSIDENILPN
jgi:ApaG protein